MNPFDDLEKRNRNWLSLSRSVRPVLRQLLGR